MQGFCSVFFYKASYLTAPIALNFVVVNTRHIQNFPRIGTQLDRLSCHAHGAQLNACVIHLYLASSRMRRRRCAEHSGLPGGALAAWTVPFAVALVPNAFTDSLQYSATQRARSPRGVSKVAQGHGGTRNRCRCWGSQAESGYTKVWDYAPNITCWCMTLKEYLNGWVLGFFGLFLFYFLFVSIFYFFLKSEFPEVIILRCYLKAGSSSKAFESILSCHRSLLTCLDILWGLTESTEWCDCLC